MYEPTANGRGVVITLENKHKAVAADGRESLRQNKILDKMPPSASGEELEQANPTDSSGIKQGSISIDEVGPAATLRRRVTEAATLIADGIRIPAEDMLSGGVGPDGGVLTTSPAVQSLQSDQLLNVQDKDATTIAIDCMECGSDTRAEARARAFVRGPRPLSIVLCSNRLYSQREVDEVLVHELVHLYDVHTREMDLKDCRQLAYSEVRAAREAECSKSYTSFTTNMCARDKATVATRNLFPEEGKKCVCDVFNDAMNDLSPFSFADGEKGNDVFKAGCFKQGRGKYPSTQQPNSQRTTEKPFEFASPRQSDR